MNKNFVFLLCKLFVVASLANVICGCRSVHTTKENFVGQTVIKRDSYSLHLYKMETHDRSKGCFNVSFMSNNRFMLRGQILRATYRFRSEPERPFDIVQNESSTSLIPTAECITERWAEHPLLKSGRYRIHLEYQLRDREDSCDFDVRYSGRVKARWVPAFWYGTGL